MKIDRNIDEYAIVYEGSGGLTTVARFDGLVVDESIIEACFESICAKFSPETVTFVIAVDLFRPWDDESNPYKRYEVG